MGDGVYAEGLFDFVGGGGENGLCMDDTSVVDQDCWRAKLCLLVEFMLPKLQLEVNLRL